MVIPKAYRHLLGDRRARRLLSGLGVSSLGDGLSTVTIAWLAVRTAPVGSLGAIVVLTATGASSPVAYVVLLAGSSLLAGWGSAGQYTLLAEVGGEDGRLAANSLASAQVWLATILGPARSRTARPARRHLVLLLSLRSRRGCPSGVRRARPACSCGSARRVLDELRYRCRGLDPAVGTLRRSATRRITLLIVAGWGACLVPFAFATLGVTLACFAIGGPVVAGIGAGWTLTASGAATVLVAVAATVAWRRPAHTPRHSHHIAINYQPQLQEDS